MKVKIINYCNENKLNKVLENLEANNRLIEDIKLVREKIWILHYPDNYSKELKKLRKDFEALKKKVLR